MSSKHRIARSDPNFPLSPEVKSSCSPFSNPSDSGTKTHKSSVQSPLPTGTAKYQVSSTIPKIVFNSKNVHSVTISNPLSPNFPREIPVDPLSTDISLGPSNGDSILTSTLPLNEIQEISNFPVSHDRSANSSLLFPKSPREVLPVSHSTDLRSYNGNKYPLPSNILKITNKLTDAHSSNISFVLSPKSSRVGSVYFPPPDPLAFWTNTHFPKSKLHRERPPIPIPPVFNVSEYPSHANKKAPPKNANLLLDAANYGYLGPAALVFGLQTSRSSQIERSWAHEFCLLLDEFSETGSTVSLAAYTKQGEELRRYFALKRQLFYDPDFNYLLESLGNSDVLSLQSLEELIAVLLLDPLPGNIEKSLSDELILLYSRFNHSDTKENLDLLKLKYDEAIDYMTRNHFVSIVLHESISPLASDIITPNVQCVENSSLSPSANQCAESMCAFLVYLYLQSINNNSSTLSNLDFISTISPVKVPFLLSPNAASFIPQQQQPPQYTQDHQSASADKSFSPLMSSISSIESTSSPTSVTWPLSPVATTFSPQQQPPPDSPYSPEEEMPVYYEEDDDDSVDDSFLFDDYLFSLDLEPGADSPSLLSTLSFSPEESSSCTEEMTSVPEVPLGIVVVVSPSPPPQSTHVVDRGGGGVISTPVCTPPLVGICSPPPPAAFVAAWWEGWKSSHLISDDYTPVDDFSSPPPPVTVEVAWWEGWKSLTLPIYLFLFSFSLAAISSPPPPVTPEVAWWEGWKLFSNTSSSPSVLSTVTSSHPRSRARRLAVTTSPLLLLSLLLNVIFFLNVCTLSVFPPDVSSNVLRSEPVSLAPGSSEVGRVLPLSIPVAPSRTLAETPWRFPQFTLPVIPLAYCPLSSLCSRKGPRQVFYLLYFSVLLSSILLLPVPRVGRMVPFEEPILIYKPG